MQLPAERPSVLSLCNAVIRAASSLVPEHGDPLIRRDWVANWRGKIHDRWELYHAADAWSHLEDAKLLALSAVSFVDAASQQFLQPPFQQKFRHFVQSPVSCLSLLTAVLLLITLLSGGLAASRNLLFNHFDDAHGRLAYAWLHTMRGDGDRPLPVDVIPAWDRHSTLVRSAAAFRSSHQPVRLPSGNSVRTLVISTEPHFFDVFEIRPAVGSIPSVPGVVLSYNAWSKLFRADPRVLGSKVTIGSQTLAVSAVLPAHAEPLTRQSTIYLLHPHFDQDDAYAVLRVRSGVSAKQLNTDLTKVAEDITYYFLQGQLRYSFAGSAVFAPVRSFGAATLASAVLLLAAVRMKWSIFRHAAQRRHRRTFARQALFFALKTSLALTCVFTACLEWSRSPSAILFGNFDPATGPFLLWLYIAGTMAVLFWSTIDQKARCRECLRLLVFPVRIGSPGNLLLDWSGTEFCCSEGHGVLHVPHLAPSWSEDWAQWISLDDSWHSLFHDGKIPNEKK